MKFQMPAFFRRFVPSAATAFLLVFLLSACETPLRERQFIMLNLNIPTEAPDMSTSKLIERMQKATDPEGKFKKAKSFVLTQRFVSEREMEKSRITTEYFMETRFMRPDSMRILSFRNGRPFSDLIYRNGEAWRIDPKTKHVSKVPEGLPLNLCRNSCNMMKPDKSFLDIFPIVELATVYLDKTRYYRLVCYSEDEQIAPYVVYVNPDTFLSAKAQTILYTDDGAEFLYTADTLEYKLVDGVKMPIRTIVQANKTKDLSILLDFVLDPRITEADFELPKGLKFE